MLFALAIRKTEFIGLRVSDLYANEEAEGGFTLYMRDCKQSSEPVYKDCCEQQFKVFQRACAGLPHGQQVFPHARASWKSIGEAVTTAAHAIGLPMDLQFCAHTTRHAGVARIVEEVGDNQAALRKRTAMSPATMSIYAKPLSARIATVRAGRAFAKRASAGATKKKTSISLRERVRKIREKRQQ